MTKTKIQKTVAIVLAMCLAFALMSVTMMNNAFAEAAKFEKETYTLEFEEPEVAVNANAENNYVAVRDSYEGTPSFTVKLTFKGNDGTFGDQDVPEFVKLYSDSQLTNEVAIPADYFIDVSKTTSEISFTLRLNLMADLENNKTYYLKLDKALSATADTIGDDIVVQFAVPGTYTTTTTTTTTKPTTSTTKSTTRTYRTLTTTRTTLRTVTTTKRITVANTGDESNMPLWIAVAIIAAGASAIAYVWKEKEN